MFPSGEKDRGKPVRSRDNCNLSMNAYFLLSFTKFLFFFFRFPECPRAECPSNATSPPASAGPQAGEATGLDAAIRSPREVRILPIT